MNISISKLTSLVPAKLFMLLAFMSTVLITQAQEYEAENEGWIVNLEEAYALSQETGKPILANFTGSDWCGWCKKLTASVFVKDEFKTWAEDNVILLELDYPRRKQLPTEIRQQNASLQKAFKITGYPTIWVFGLDKDGAGQWQIDAYGKTGYAKTAKDFTSAIDRMISNKTAGE